MRYKDISIKKKLYFTIVLMSILILLELLTLKFSIGTLSAVRGYVGGEGLWSKAQKDAVFALNEYARTGEEVYYEDFNEAMQIPLGDRRTLVQLNSDDPDIEEAKEGFIQGANHPDDVEGMIKLFQRFYWISYIDSAIGLWAAGDSMIGMFLPIAEEIKEYHNSDSVSNVFLESKLKEIVRINKELRVLEDLFSGILGEGARWLSNLILILLFAVALTVELTGILLAITVSQSISQGLMEIIGASKRITNGEYSARARVWSGDEIGKVAMAFNDMATNLEKDKQEKLEASKQLEAFNEQLQQKNKELEQFAYIASHDLQEPLRTVNNYILLLENEGDAISDELREKYFNYINSATKRMGNLIKDLLDYSLIGTKRELMRVSLNSILDDIVADFQSQIQEKNANLIINNLPTIDCYPADLRLVFQNLISNALKFKEGEGAVVEVSHLANTENQWLFSVKDNGIGISEEYKEKIFAIFQRLNAKNKFEGTGIGLAHCMKIVQLHGGKIWVESEEDKGSTFYFTISKNIIR